MQIIREIYTIQQAKLLYFLLFNFNLSAFFIPYNCQ